MIQKNVGYLIFFQFTFSARTAKRDSTSEDNGDFVGLRLSALNSNLVWSGKS